MAAADLLAGSQIISVNPILKENDQIKAEYLYCIKKYVKTAKWQRRKYVKAALNIYDLILEGEVPAGEKREFYNDIKKYQYILVFDMAAIAGFQKPVLESKNMRRVLYSMAKDFGWDKTEKNLCGKILQGIGGDEIAWDFVKDAAELREFKDYLKLTDENLRFIREKAYNILVTATMSAGKSTFINALTGKNISLSQNMACTSKIHVIQGKPFEDGFSCEYDHELILNADKEHLMEDNEDNDSNNIIVSTYYRGELGGKRIVIKDSPGVNFSRNENHRKITEQIIRRKKYRLMVYLMNATQMGTEDDGEHLRYVKKYIGRKPILFIVNKVDAFHIEEENIEEIMERQREYLQTLGFKDPKICPVSSKAGYLAKKSQVEPLKRVERRELNCFIDYFEQMNLPEYYKKYFPGIFIETGDTEEEQLLKNSGISYVEKIIKYYYEGGK